MPFPVRRCNTNARNARTHAPFRSTAGSQNPRSFFPELGDWVVSHCFKFPLLPLWLLLKRQSSVEITIAVRIFFLPRLFRRSRAL
eukprot:6185616-Pleurochrysis_carterae.AAC.2